MKISTLFEKTPKSCESEFEIKRDFPASFQCLSRERMIFFDIYTISSTLKRTKENPSMQRAFSTQQVSLIHSESVEFLAIENKDVKDLKEKAKISFIEEN